MEKTTLKLMGQIALLALVFWVVMSGLGRRKDATISRASQKRRMNPKSIVWNQSPVVAPYASAGLLFTPSAVMNPDEA